MTQDLLDFEAAETRRDDGITRAVAHAEANHKSWLERGVGLLRLYVVKQNGKNFLSEDFVVWLHHDYPISFPKPPDARAYGGIIRSAARANMIERVGYAPAKTSNCSPKCVWRGK